MAPATTANGKPKRKRQRRRRQQSDSSSDSSSSSSSSDSDSSSEDEQPVKPAPVASNTASDSSSDDSSSSSDSSSSESDLSDFDMAGGRRRGRGRRGKAAAQQQQQQNGEGQAQAGPAANAAAELRRPYPERSPSPQRIDPAHVPLGSSLFPLLRPQTDGQAILQGQVPGDEGYKAGEELNEEEKNKTLAVSEDKLERERAREQRFGEWWRARLVGEFEADLGGLAAVNCASRFRFPLGRSDETSCSLQLSYRSPVSLLPDSNSSFPPSQHFRLSTRRLRLRPRKLARSGSTTRPLRSIRSRRLRPLTTMKVPRSGARRR